eukprot:TRINITY_DN5808_c0_g1_i3.p1 TRINITY_DN5808_c0_g1~~TRINITY_DN5808_c0_g1_i3.p1  ORF type:complete len:331 (-),score=28.93 TRINITY_DN5808_c0_g1_i3:305-1297(-)
MGCSCSVTSSTQTTSIGQTTPGNDNDLGSRIAVELALSSVDSTPLSESEFLSDDEHIYPQLMRQLLPKMESGTIPSVFFWWFPPQSSSCSNFSPVSGFPLHRAVLVTGDKRLQLTQVESIDGTFSSPSFLSSLSVPLTSSTMHMLCTGCLRFQSRSDPSLWHPAEAYYLQLLEQVRYVSHTFCPECTKLRAPLATMSFSSQDDLSLLSKPTVMIVEDDPIFSRLVSHFAHRLHYNVVSFSSGCAALNYLVSHGQSSVDIVVTDVIMPGLSGVEFFARLREAGCFAPCLGMSGCPEYRGACLGAGMSDFISKPFSLHTFQQALATLVGPCD